MKATTFAAISLLASAAVAQPHRQHQHMDRHHKREGPPVVWITEVVSTTTTVDITTTIWVSEGFVAPTSEAKAVTTKPSSTAASSSVEQKPAQFFEPASSQTPSPTSVYVAPTPTTTPVAVAPVVASTPSPEPVKSSSSTSTTSVAPVYVPTTTAAPVVVPTTTSPAAAATTSTKSSSGGSSSGTCSTGSPCTGEMTFYDIAANEYGSCGYEGIDGTKDKIVAISAQLMGTVSNGNPMCGKTVTVKGSNGKTVVAKVVDKCPGCVAHAIDLSRAAFIELDSFDVGRINVDWWFNE